ncbi:MAG TPA: RDD family protein [Gammaproteobacteria bacterium]|jgi:uncharacterized RDD family membrane protein YckC|nr:RDD family protein [Gammaproteobacteria bacterium]
MESIIRIPSVTGVDVELRIAGPGGRSYAFVIDWHIRFLAAAAWFIAGTFAFAGGLRALPAGAATASYGFAVVAPAIVIYFLYHPVLEILLRGQTPGMRMAGVRLVALADGGAPGIGALLIRNVFRLVDSLPSFYAIGLVTTMLTKHAVRIGDIAAGTVLVYDEAPGEALLSQLSGKSVERLGLAQAQLVRDVLDRWPQLGSDARYTLAKQLLTRAGVTVPRDDDGLKAKLQELIA